MKRKYEESPKPLINKFDFFNFYETRTDTWPNGYGNNPAIKLKMAGSLLIARYYQEKYGTNIVFAKKNHPSLPPSIFQFRTLLINYISGIKTAATDYRRAFLFGMEDGHALFVLYLREQGNEGVLIADTFGLLKVTDHLANELKKQTGIDVYVVAEARQRIDDSYSCYADALVFGRDSTAFDKEQNTWKIPALLNFLKINSTKTEGQYFKTRLPDELLKTCQRPSFFEFHREKADEKIVHKNETISMFRNRYTEKINIAKCPNAKEFYSYPRKKGLKFAEIIEIQFYLEQISKIAGNSLSKEEKLNFINQAKKIMRSEGEVCLKKENLYKFAQEFIENMELSESDEPSINGLSCY